MAAAEHRADLPLTIVVLGASGDLARKKLFPALFALHCRDLLPERFHVVGLARSAMTSEQFRERITENLTCRYTPENRCAERMGEFLSRCSYVAGGYDSTDSFLELYGAARELEGPGDANRMFYMAIPPFLFMPVARAIGDTGLVKCGPGEAWSRVVVEKPFGNDRESSDELVGGMAQVFSEQQTFRIDHYLGKEVIQNLLVLRFANQIFAPMWNNTCISSVEISWREDIGVGNRASYFDKYGILRDVMQNHLLQMLALVAMEQPQSLSARHVRDEKVRVLRNVPPLKLDDVVLGQYGPGALKGVDHPGYLEEDSVPEGSRTPTFAAAELRVNTPRWQGVPFLISAGKGLDTRMTEIRIRFKPVTKNLFGEIMKTLPPNELVVRVQPDEAISFRILNKAPGLKMELVETDLDLHYESKFRAAIPDAYECLLLDIIRGDKSLFIRSDELAAAWDVFTPVLQDIERLGVQPRLYPFGSEGPS